MRWRVLSLLLGALLMGASHAHSARADVAVCQASSAIVNFGVAPSINATGMKSSGEIRMSCMAATAQTVRVCLQLASATATLHNGLGGALDAVLFRESSYASLWQAQTWIDVGAVALDGKGSSTLAVPLYAMITTPAAAISAGVFTAAQPLLYAYGPACTNGSGQIGSFTFQMLATINPTCTLSVNDLQFGAINPSQAQPVDLATSISVTCTNSTTFSITMGQGNGVGVTGPRDRRMQGPGGAQLSYGLYADPARVTPWDASNGVPGRATGGAQRFSLYGRINPGQSAPPGLYRDTVIVTVLY